jgi:hypothetical protein
MNRFSRRTKRLLLQMTPGRNATLGKAQSGDVELALSKTARRKMSVRCAVICDLRSLATERRWFLISRMKWRHFHTCHVKRSGCAVQATQTRGSRQCSESPGETMSLDQCCWGRG